MDVKIITFYTQHLNTIRFNCCLCFPFFFHIVQFYHSAIAGPACLERSCARKPIIFSKRPREPVSKTQCDCETTGNAQCPASAGGPRPSQWDSFTGDKLQNLTGRNLTDYLLKTYGNFIRRRCGKCSLIIIFRFQGQWWPRVSIALVLFYWGGEG